MKLDLPDGYQKNNPNIIDRIESDLDEDRNFHYLFTGKVGSGKTYLARIIYVSFQRQTQERWYSAKIRDTYKRYLEVSDLQRDRSKLVNRIEAPFIARNTVLDDLGYESPATEAAHEYISGLLDKRYDRWTQELCDRTIITTNLSGDQIADVYGNRTMDRLEEMCTIMKFNDESFRRKDREIVTG